MCSCLQKKWSRSCCHSRQNNLIIFRFDLWQEGKKQSGWSSISSDTRATSARLVSRLSHTLVFVVLVSFVLLLSELRDSHRAFDPPLFWFARSWKYVVVHEFIFRREPRGCSSFFCYTYLIFVCLLCCAVSVSGTVRCTSWCALFFLVDYWFQLPVLRFQWGITGWDDLSRYSTQYGTHSICSQFYRSRLALWPVPTSISHDLLLQEVH
jgi:hypothetical protein